MVKKLALVCLLVLLGAGLSSAAFGAECGKCTKPAACNDQTVCGDPLKKLGRGVCNAVTFPFEIPNQIQRTNNTDGPMAAYTWGVLKGVGMTALRAVVGVYEIVTFPFPFPEGYKPILTDPEFIFEDQNW